MRVEKNIDYSVKNNNIPKNNIQYYNLKQKSDTVSFSANLNRPAKGFLGKLTDVISSPINTIKKYIENAELEAKLKKEAEEAAKRAEQAALEAEIAAEQAEKLQKAKETGKQIIADWQAQNKGLFQDRKYVDDTGEVILCPDPYKAEANLRDYDIRVSPKRGEYTLANIGQNELYCSNPAGAMNLYIRGTGNGPVVTHIRGFYEYNNEFKDIMFSKKWHMRHTYLQSTIDGKMRPCTVLTTGFNAPCCRSLGRFPGVNFVIEGHIPLKDMQEIKKNIVEKGLWKNYKEHEDIDAHLAIYNEIINYLNK